MDLQTPAGMTWTVVVVAAIVVVEIFADVVGAVGHRCVLGQAGTGWVRVELGQGMGVLVVSTSAPSPTS